MAPPPLMEELVEEILLRFPPHEPASLVRASLKPHRSLRRVSSFAPTAAFCSPHAESRRWRALDARHGRVLRWMGGHFNDNGVLAVWDPITGEKRKLPILPRQYMSMRNAAVLCSVAAGACDHLDCHAGPFIVVSVGATVVCTYLPDTDDWSEPISGPEALDSVHCLMRSSLVGNELYFGSRTTNRALKYDLELRQVSWIELPPACSSTGLLVLTTTEDGGLGLATIHGSKIYVWSRKVGPQVDAEWTQSKIVDLETLLPIDAVWTLPDVVGFAEGIDVIFVRANNVLFTIDLKTYKVKKVCNDRVMCGVVPYMSFYTPALGTACTDEGPSAGG
ncbi:unnamed protein product [Urochloa decumbens]|uniref:F-box protein AT5G49610-like beta-propeller domain-containing protein n=1 Tax=Urochloa decumbens TaxID=240449 RepID=A0ABC9FLD6_9POAL